jgi:N-acetylmuramoyl-L-alanine amidase
MVRRSQAVLFAASVTLFATIAGLFCSPTVGATTSPKAPTNQPAKPRFTTYVVKPGDSLIAISRQYGVAIPDLRTANISLLNSDVVKIGVKLNIPQIVSRTGLPATIRTNPERLRLRPIIHHWSKKNGLPPDLVEATLYLESGWNQSRVSSTGAIGVGQLMPGTTQYIKRDLIGPSAGGLELNPEIPEHNIRMSARYLRHLLKVTNGNVDSALHGYYQGFGSIAANGLYDDSKAYSASIKALRKRFRTDFTGL